MPTIDISFIRPTAMPTPAPTPRIDPTKPSSSASTSTDRLTCLREEPIARIRPISRVRWATSIEKVLTIRKMPTRKAIPAKPSMAYLMTFRNSPMPSRFSSEYSFCVCTLNAPPAVEGLGDVLLELRVGDPVVRRDVELGEPAGGAQQFTLCGGGVEVDDGRAGVGHLEGGDTDDPRGDVTGRR